MTALDKGTTKALTSLPYSLLYRQSMMYVILVRDSAMGVTKNDCPEYTGTEYCRYGKYTTHYATVVNCRGRADIDRQPYCSDDIAKAIEIAEYGEREAITCYVGR